MTETHPPRIVVRPVFRGSGYVPMIELEHVELVVLGAEPTTWDDALAQGQALAEKIRGAVRRAGGKA